MEARGNGYNKKYVYFEIINVIMTIVILPNVIIIIIYHQHIQLLLIINGNNNKFNIT